MTSSARRIALVVAAIVVVACVGVLSSQPVRATSFIVSNTNDGGSGSLRAAIQAANTTSGDDLITFSSNISLPATITLTSGPLVINPTNPTDKLTIQGPGASALAIDGNCQSNCGTVNASGGSTIFTVNSGVTVAISGLTIQHGVGTSTSGPVNTNGGGIFNDGGIVNVARCTFSANAAVNPGGGVGGGIVNNGGTMSVTDSTFSGNAGFQGGGIVNTVGSTLTVTGSTFTANTGTGTGGGVANYGTLTMTNSTFSGNFSESGGGVFDLGAGTVTLTNSTLTNNNVDGASGSGGGIGILFSGTVTLVNTIVAGNSATNGATNPDIGGTATVNAASHHNLIGDAGSSGGLTNGTNGNIVGHAALLDALGNYGGPTQTVRLLTGSPALAAGDTTVCAQPLPPPTVTGAFLASGNGAGGVDQRGFPRPVTSAIPAATFCAIGAYEPQPATIAATGGTPQSAAVGTAFAASLQATVKDDQTNPLPGWSVTFTAPPQTGASGTFAGGGVVTTKGTGVATAPTFTANTHVGTYNVTANLTTGPLGTPASFSLINGGACVVTSALDPSDAGLLTLRDAVAVANGGGCTGNAITFAKDLTVTLDQTQGTLNLTHAMTIDGTGHTIIVDGGCTAGCGTATPIGGVRVFDVSGGVNVGLTGLTIQHGTSGGGGGIRINGGDTLTVTNSTISANTNIGSRGGGIFNNGGTLTVTNSTISGNAAAAGGSGGGISSTGTLTVTNSTLSGNAAIISGNGGGIEDDGTLTVTDSTFSGNAATRGANGGNGGGIYHVAGAATVTNSTFSGNAVTRGSGGGILSITGLTLTNSTLTGNSANGAGESGGGIAFGGNVTLLNTIIAGNTATGGATDPDIFGTVDTANSRNNLIGDENSSGGLTNGSNGNQVGVATPLLGALGNYGGPTQTIPLLPGSPAIDAGASGGGVPATDQRGKPRVGTPDIGAFESQGFTATIVSGNTQQTVVNTPFAQALVVALAPNNPGEPVQGGVVSFVVSSPPGGASATLSAPTATVDTQAHASVTATANGVATPQGGSPYGVVARGTGIGSVEFYLGNLPPTIALAPTSLPAGVKGIVYPATTITASGIGSVPPFTFSALSGTLPPGLALSASGTLSGTPTAVGSFTFTVTATDAHGFTGTQQYTVTVTATPLVSIAVTPANVTLKVGDTQQYTATGTYQDGSTANLTSQVTWGSDNTAIAKPNDVKPGEVVAVAPGSAQIIATLGSISGQTGFTVPGGTSVGVAPVPQTGGRPAGTTGEPGASPVPAPGGTGRGGTGGGTTPAPAPTGR